VCAMMIFIVFVVLVCWAHQALVRNFELWSCVCVLHASPQSTNNSLVVDVGSASVGDLLGHETPYQVPLFCCACCAKQRSHLFAVCCACCGVCSLAALHGASPYVSMLRPCQLTLVSFIVGSFAPCGLIEGWLASVVWLAALAATYLNLLVARKLICVLRGVCAPRANVTDQRSRCRLCSSQPGVWQLCVPLIGGVASGPATVS
jgi:hypothetical protein